MSFVTKMNQLPLIPQHENDEKKLLLSCVGFPTLLVKGNWEEFGPPGEFSIELVDGNPSMIILKSLLAKFHHQINISMVGRITQQNEFSFLIGYQENGQSTFFGLRLTDNSPAALFYSEVQRLLQQSRSPTTETRPKVQQQNFMAVGSVMKEQIPPEEKPPDEKNEEANKDNKIDASCEQLAISIHKGKHEEAIEHAKLLCDHRANVTIHTLPKDFVSGKGNYSLMVRVTDRDANETSYRLQIDHPKNTTVRMLKQEMWNRFQFPIHSQRWVMDKYLGKDNDTLAYCGITQPAQISYMYLKYDVSVAEPLYESIGNVGDNGLLCQAQGFPQGFSQNAQPSNLPSPPLIPNQGFNPYQTQQRAQQPYFPGQNFGNHPAAGFQSYYPYPNEPLQRDGAMPRQARFAAPPGVPIRKKAQQVVGWDCEQCTYKNPPTFPGCKVCSYQRPDDYQVPDDYELTQEEKERTDLERLNEKLVIEAEFKRKEEEAKRAQDNYRNVMQFVQNKLLPNHEEFDCPICYTTIDKGTGVMLRECLHCFCRDCLLMHVNTSEDPEVHCPENSGFPCPAAITGQEIQELLPEEDFAKFLDRSLAKAEFNTENSFHCRTTNCKGWCVYEDEVNEYKCAICQNVNCLTCKAQHPDMSCKDYQEDLKLRAENDEAAKKTQQMLNELINRGDAMYCPQCKVILQKKSGCDWMRCTMCRTEICWATKGPRWGPGGKGDTSAGCKCGVDGERCTPTCGNCH